MPDSEAPLRVERPRSPGRHSEALGYQPALDGLRALAVLAVLFFHARFTWASGGFLGVSTFFTLSGFLITTLMLREWSSQGSISLRGFFRRRFRRLLPASWFTLALVIAMGAVGVWSVDQLRSLRGDVPWAISELINWHFVLMGRTYGAQFEAPSPLEHFWSLAVEQQFYVLLPLVVLATLRLGRRRRHKLHWNGPATDPGLTTGVGSGPDSAAAARTRYAPLVTVLALAGLVSLALNGVLARGSVSRAYFGTDTRLAELVAGALLACVGLRALRGGSPLKRRLLEVLGVLGLLGSFALWATASVGAQLMYPWGFMATAAASVGLIVGAMQQGAFAKVLSVWPLVALGRISYGVYVLHWPIFLWLDPTRIRWPQWPLFGLRMAVTVAAAVVMFNVLETPIRSGARLPGRLALRVAAPAAVIILLSSFMVTSDLPAESELAAASHSAGTTTTGPPAPVRVLVIGDELAASWRGATGSESVPLEVTVESTQHCGAVMGGFVQLDDGNVEKDTDRCETVMRDWVAAAVRQRPDVVIVASALRDVANRRLDGPNRWDVPGSPAVDDFLAIEVSELVDKLSASGAKVLLATAPHMRSTAPAPPVTPPTLPSDARRRNLLKVAWTRAQADAPPPVVAANDNARIDRWNQILASVTQKGTAGSLDVGATMASWPGGEFDPQRRAADGVGMTEMGRTELSAALAETVKDARPPIRRPDPAAANAAKAPLPPAPPPGPRRTVAPGRKADVLVVGDSVAYNVAVGLTDWAKDGGVARVRYPERFGCPIARGGQYHFLDDTKTFEDRCDWATATRVGTVTKGGEFPELLRELDPEVVVLASGIWEVVDRRLPGDDRFRHIGEPMVNRYILAEFLSAIDLLGSKGATVAVLTFPHFEAARDQGYTNLPESDPARVDKLNRLLQQAVSLRPGVATLVDFQGWLAAQPGGELDAAKRTDGLHFYDKYSRVIADWLGPEVMKLARNGIPAPPGG